MTDLRALLATALLAALAVGGVALPLAHDVAHAAEQTEARAAHGDHHHHEVTDDHGAEVLPFCPDAAHADVACALCQVHGAALTETEQAAMPDATVRLSTDGDRAGEARHGGTRARGPPRA